MSEEADSRHYPWSSLLAFSLLFIGSFKYVHGQNDYFEDTGSVWVGENIEPLASSSAHSATISSKLTSLDVICGKEYMTVRAEFSAPFHGIVFSKGTYGQSKCVYVKPHSGLTHTTFNVRYDECGTKPDLQGKYFENTIVIQYGTDIIEALDEAKRLRCEWFEAYEKPATFRPAIPVADLDIIEMNFQGDEIDCWMSIQEGKGPWASEISRIVTVGQPLSIVVAINDRKNQFDMKVKSCFAHDGVKPPIYLIDEEGCVLRPKMISPFKKLRNINGKASLISYAQFLAFKFPDSVDVQIQCTVEVCRHGCVESCETAYKQSEANHAVKHLASPHSQQSVFSSAENSTAHQVLVDKVDLLDSANSNHQMVLTEKTVDPVSINLPHKNAPAHDSGVIESDKQNNLQDIANYLQNQYQSEPINIDHKPLPSEKVVGFDDSVKPVRENPSASGVPVSSGLMMGPMPMMSRPKHPVVPPLNVKPPRPFAEPVAQVMNIPLSPIYTPSNKPGFPGLTHLFNPFNNIRLFNKKHNAPQLPFGNFLNNQLRPTAYMPNDNFEFVHHPVNNNGPLHRRGMMRTKRFASPQGEIGLSKGFQVVTSLDLSFSPNMSADQMPIYEGKPEAIVYGICFSTSHVFYFLTASLLLLLSGIFISIFIVFKIERSRTKPL